MMGRILAASIVFAGIAHAESPSVRLAYFTADWCANCAVLGPAIEYAIARVDGAERVDFDSSTPAKNEGSRRIAVAQHLEQPFDRWNGAAGFAVLTAADSGEVMGCVTSVYSAPEIERALRRAVKRVRTLPAGQRALPDASACPPKRGGARRTTSAG